MSRKINYLVVGEQNFSVVGKTGLSSKHRKVLNLINQGSQIDIIDEDLFFCLVADPS